MYLFLFSGLITEDDICSPTSSITSPVITLPDYLHQSGCKLHPVKGDGNCMFRSLSNHLLGNEEELDAIRTLNTIWKSQSSLLWTISKGQKWAYTKSSYFEDGQPSTWGTQIEIEAAAALFQVPVYECVQSQDGETYHWEVHHPRAPADRSRHPTIVWRRSSLFCSHSSSLWACLQEELSLWLHSWQRIRTT